jgi:hypothetical protein
MTTRILALILGLIAGAVVLAICIFVWSDAVAVAPIHAPDLVAALSVPANRVAWAVAAVAAACAVAALFTGLVGGIAETLIAARRIGALQAGPTLAGWSCAGDWRTVFDSTAIAVAAGPILEAAVIPREGRAAGVDSISLLALGRLWLDRLTFRRAIRPLPLLVLSADIMLALISDLSGTGWELALAAGVAGWFLISLARYVTFLVLSPFIERTVAATLSATRQAMDAPASDIVAPRGFGQAAATQPSMNQPLTGPLPTAPVGAVAAEAEAIARTVAEILAEPLERLAAAAEKMGSAAPPQEQTTDPESTVDTAMAEVRAGIERLLAASPKR